MPLSIDVGLSRKRSRDFQSQGISINIAAELDQSLLARPSEMQVQISELYAQAQTALDHQAATMEPSRAPSGNGHSGNASRGNAQHRPQHDKRNPSPAGSVPATPSQRRAILAIARTVNLDPTREARDLFGAEIAVLNRPQASELIDHLRTFDRFG